jgi:uncharacterized membrane protein YdbT with pleckstrin-like domain
MNKLSSLENIDVVIGESSNRESYLLALKEYRELYQAERNIMLVIAACFVFFVFHRILYNIRKYAELEYDLQEHNLKVSGGKSAALTDRQKEMLG